MGGTDLTTWLMLRDHDVARADGAVHCCPGGERLVATREGPVAPARAPPAGPRRSGAHIPCSVLRRGIARPPPKGGQPVHRARPVVSGAQCAYARALPFLYCSQLKFQSVQPFPISSFRDVPLTLTGSPSIVRENSHAPSFIETFTQPCDTLVRPCTPSDHGAAWMNSPPQVSRCAKSMSVR